MEADVGVAAQPGDPAEDGVVGVALRRATSTIESATATSSASRTPTATTPAMVTAAMATSTRLVRASPRQAAGSTSPMAAATITAPRVALGR